MAIPLDPAAAASVGRFLDDTRLSAPSPGPPHAPALALAGSALEDAPTPGESRDGGPAVPVPAAADDAYKRLLRYVPNTRFAAAGLSPRASLAGASVPNTFKHKSHPNARTKHHIGEPPQPPAAASGHADFAAATLAGHGVQTSTVKAAPAGADFAADLDRLALLDRAATPSWMPAALDARWPDPAPPADCTAAPAHGAAPYLTQSPAADDNDNDDDNNAPLALLGTGSNTCVHRPQASGGAPATPMWKKMADQYRHAHEQAGELPLRHIFLPSGSSPALPRAAHPAGGHALTSTVLTPAATRDSELHLTQQQIHQLEGLLEQARGQPDDLPLRGSPLKLFGSEYDTFTKAILTRFVDQARSTANSVQRAPAPEPAEPTPPAELAPRLNIKHFTRAGDYTDHDFMQNADHVFAHLQRKGLPADAARQNQPLLSHTQTTATSTPKLKPRDSLDMYSYSTRSHSDLPRTRLCSPPAAPSDYTALDRSSWASGARLCSTLALSDDHVDHASYTFDELSDLASHSSEHSSPVQPARNARSTRFHSPSPRLGDARGDLFPLFESSMTSVKQFMKPPKRRAAASTREANDTREPAAENLIKWKRASQLRLLSASSKANLPDKTHHSNKTRHSNKANHSNANAPSGADSHYVKGTVKPGAFPGQYGDMIFNAQENRWVSNDKENDVGGSLDSIEDLFSDCDALKLHLQSRPGVLVQPDKAKDRRPLEVSFQFPASENSPVTKTHAADLTSVSECGNATFSQSNKELVSLITGSTNQIVWDTITSIDLSDKNIDRVENLEQYLPAVKSIDLSKNRLRFIEGLPLALFELDVTSNSLSDMASFHKFHDLQVVNASFNSFRSFSCLSNNVNLTKVNLMGNQIESLNGFPAIHALISLDLSRNHIRGHVHLENLQLPNLKELNLSENLISNITGIESLENLRILNVNENRIVALSCSRTHRRLKKLLCKFNDLNELKLDCFPFLRILRLDGNSLVSITGLKKLEHLHELSAKCQNSPQIVEGFFRAAADVPSVDFSGNSSLVQLLPNISVDAFYNVNQLNLSAVGLSILPGDFSEKFFNVRELNLSFNKLSDLKALQNLKQLKKLQVLSNNITKMEDILTGLQRSRKTLKSLDMRLNIINFEFYPYVFSPQELQLVKENHGKSAAESPIPIQALEDIESFTIHYNALSKSRNEWQARDNEFFRQMRKEGKDRRLKERLDYETILIGYFPNLKELDGSDVPHERRAAFGNLAGQ